MKGLLKVSKVSMVRMHKPVEQQMKRKTLVECIYEGFGWCHRESNQGHKDFQSFALPTEL